MKDKDWRRLLERMKEGTVVPVIGPRLLVDDEGSPLTLRVARRLLADYDLDGDGSLPPFRELTEVATRLKGKLRNPQDLYGDVDSALKLVGMLESGNRGKEPKGEAIAIPKPLTTGGDHRLSCDGDPDARRHARAGAEVRQTGGP